MVDISFQKDDMEMLNKITDLVWIDHHKTAIDDHKHLKIKGIQRTDKAACELCWEYFFPETKTPKAVYLLGKYDIWDHSDEQTLPFQYGIRFYKLEPKDLRWNNLFEDNEDCFYNAEFDWHFCKSKLFDDILQDGKTCLNYQNQSNEFKSQAAFKTNFEGYDCICINSIYSNSMIFDSLKKEFDIMIVFGYYGKWKVSMYTNKDINVGKIAKKYGGGGHEKACGFSCSTKQMQEFGFIK